MSKVKEVVGQPHPFIKTALSHGIGTKTSKCDVILLLHVPHRAVTRARHAQVCESIVKAVNCLLWIRHNSVQTRYFRKEDSQS